MILHKIWNLVKFEILNPKISKFEILNPNTKISNLDTNFWILMIFVTNLKKILPKLTKLVITQNLTKSQNLKSLTLKSKISNFPTKFLLNNKSKIRIPKSPNCLPNWLKNHQRFNRFEIWKVRLVCSKADLTSSRRSTLHCSDGPVSTSDQPRF